MHTIIKRCAFCIIYNYSYYIIIIDWKTDLIYKIHTHTHTQRDMCKQYCNNYRVIQNTTYLVRRFQKSVRQYSYEKSHKYLERI